MSTHLTSLSDALLASIRTAIQTHLADAVVDVSGGGGHYTIAVTSAGFAGQSKLEQQRTVYSAIAHLMKGENAPLHAVDQLITRLP